MTVPAAETTRSSLTPLLERLAREHFPDHGFSEPEPGTVVARFFQNRIASAFQPVVRAADSALVGHQGLLRLADEAGIPVAPWSVFSQATDDMQLVQLDRLCRTVHALNYFPEHKGEHVLFLNVEQRLLKAVSADHGAYYESILKHLDVPPHRVVIVLPASAIDDPVTFVRAAISYRIRGYRVLAQVRSVAEADLAHVFLADPHYVAIDVVNPPTPKSEGDVARLVGALTRRGISSVARRIESEEQAKAARNAGFGFLQGWYFAAGGKRS